MKDEIEVHFSIVGWFNIRVMSAKGIQFVDEEKDRLELAAQFADGNYIAHHSRRFNDSVHFHYRIISRERFDKTIFPLIEQNKAGKKE